jgi:hypothetical protein
MMIKSLFQTSLKFAALAMLLAFTGTASRAQTRQLQVSQLEHLAAKASQTVDVNIDENLIQLTAKFFSSNDPDEKKVKEIITGLKGIYVRSFEFENEGEYSPADLESIRSQLRGPGWTKIVNVSSKKEGSVEIYLLTSTSRIGGLVVVAADPKELTVVNLVGTVDLDKLSQLEGQFGVPELGLERPAKPKKN